MTISTSRSELLQSFWSVSVETKQWRFLLFCCCLIHLTTVKGTIRQRYLQQDIELVIKTILKLMKNFKTLHDLSPNFMKEIFYHFSNLTHR